MADPKNDVLDELHRWLARCQGKRQDAVRQWKRPDHNGPGPAGQPGLRWAGRALAYAEMAVAVESRIVALEDAADESGVDTP